MITLKCDCGSWNMIIYEGPINGYLCLDCGAFYQERTMKRLSLEEMEKMYESGTGKSLKIPENKAEFMKMIDTFNPDSPTHIPHI